MDLFKQGMKGPTRPAPAVPGGDIRYTPTSWNDDLFGADVFEPTPVYMQKKPPPPRPPPPKLSKHYSKVPDLPSKPSHFIRRPTVLSSLLSRKSKTSNPSVNVQSLHADFNSEVDPIKMFPKCDPKNVQTAALIDLSSPPSSPTFTTRSSSDGLSVDSFGSDATTSTNHHNAMNGGNASQAESGFEDDFDLFLNTRKGVQRDDTMDDITAVDPFSPQPVLNRPPVMKKPVISRDPYDFPSTAATIPPLKGPTIIRAKPARPKPPDSASILKSTFGNSFPLQSTMTVNTTIPIQKITNGFGDSYESKWSESPERESSPPMPTVPPPPPPPEAEGWGDLEEEPYAIALFDYFTDHPDDLCFSTNSKVTLLRKIDHEWLYGRNSSGAEGLFPSNYVEVKVPLPNEEVSPAHLGTAVALYDFHPVEAGDLGFQAGDTVKVMYKISEEWHFGECNGTKGQFPANYVQMS